MDISFVQYFTCSLFLENRVGASLTLPQIIVPTDGGPDFIRIVSKVILRYCTYYLLTEFEGHTGKYKPKAFHTAQAGKGCMENHQKTCAQALKSYTDGNFRSLWIYACFANIRSYFTKNLFCCHGDSINTCKATLSKLMFWIAWIIAYLFAKVFILLVALELTER